MQRIKQHYEEYISRIDISIPNEKQMELTEKFLIPNLESIQEDIEVCREAIDIIMKKAKRKLKKHEKKQLEHMSKDYPIGYCREIRDNVLDISRYIWRHPECYGLNELRKFEQKGGLIKEVWGIKDEKCFLNGIQAGDLFIDSANNTVYKDNPKVQINRLKSSGMQNVTSIEQYANIAEKYWGFSAFPNIYTPRLAPHLPLIFVTKENGIFFEKGDSSTSIKNILSQNQQTKNHFELARQFIFESKYSQKRLPKEHANSLREIMNNGQNSFLESYLECQTAGDEFSTEMAFHEWPSIFEGGVSRKDLLDYHSISVEASRKTRELWKMQMNVY